MERQERIRGDDVPFGPAEELSMPAPLFSSLHSILRCFSGGNNRRGWDFSAAATKIVPATTLVRAIE